MTLRKKQTVRQKTSLRGRVSLNDNYFSTPRRYNPYKHSNIKYNSLNIYKAKTNRLMEKTDKFTTILGNSEPSRSIQVKEPKKSAKRRFEQYN